MAKINAEFQCKLCKAKFSNLKDYTKHCNERELLKFKCATCSKKFPCYKLLQKHVIEERKSGFCEICKTTVKSLKMHMDRRHRKYNCDICKEFESMNYSEFCKHAGICAKYVNNVQALGHFCSICDEHFHNITALHKHLNTEHAHLWCVRCSKSYHSEFFLQRHIKDSHKRKKYGYMQMHHFKRILCDPPKNFYVKGYFNNHFQKANGAGGRASNRKFNCARCKRPHSSKAKLVKHIAQICYSPKIDLIPQRSTRSSIKML